MAVVQVTGEVTAGNTKGQQYYGVFVKEQWVDDWIFVPYLRPMFSSDNAAPTIGFGQFHYATGMIKQNYDLLYDIWDPLFLQGWFIQVRALSFYGLWTCWTGMVEAEALDEVGTNSRTTVTYSNQFLGAYDMKYPLRRGRVRRSYVGPTPDPDGIGRTLTFNKRNERGLGLMGNMSSAVSSRGVHTFSDDGELWTHLKIAEYVLEFFQPSDVQYVFTGATGALNQMVGVWNFRGMEVFEVLNVLINRRRGLGWTVRTLGSGSVEIYIFSILPVSIGFAEFTIPANPWTDVINFDDLLDVRANVQISRSNTYDYVIVEGSRLKVCLSLALMNGTLERGWTSAEETAYKAADDRERATDKFKRVYTHFRIPRGWNWSYLSLKDSSGRIANPLVHLDATVNGGIPAVTWPDDHRFERTIPFQVDGAIAGTEPEFRPLFVIVEDPGNAGKYQYVDKLNTLDTPLSAMRVTPLSREMGLKVEGSVNHRFALVDFGASATEHAAQTDFNTMVATVMMQTDEVLRAEWWMPLDRASAGDRAVTINVPNAEYWFVPGGAVKDVTDGNLVFWGDSGESTVIRDDGARIRSIAVAAAAWYGLQRNIVHYVHKGIAPFHPVGMMILGANTTSFDATAIGTVVTRRRFDFTKSRMEVKTSYSELDEKVFAA